MLDTREDAATARLAAGDNLLLALRPVPAGATLPGGARAAEDVPAGHRLAATDITAGDPLVKDGTVIGLAATDIAAGTRLSAALVDAAPGALAGLPPQSTPAPLPPASFQGFVREDGRVGTRNTVGVFVVGNCGASAARQAADWFDEDRLAEWPNVDAVVPYVHEIGCGMEMTGEPMDLLRRTISGIIRNPNTAAAVVVALGCERNNLRGFLEQEKLAVGARLQTVTIQDVGGIRNAVDAAKRMVLEMLPAANAAQRQPVPAARLTVGVQSVAPDGLSGLSANPALGVAMDLLVQQGGTVILSQTPELVALEEAVLARAATPEVAEALRARLDWWRQYNAGRDTQLNGRLNAAVAAAGLCGPQDKAADGLQRAGTTAIRATCAYAAPVPQRGLVFMDTPDYAPVSVTGQIAGGATLIAMTTGRGTAFGSLPAPAVKIASNSATFARLGDDLDIDCGGVVHGREDVEAAGRRIFEQLLRHASGEKTRSEAEGMGENEFVPWPIGVLA
jgi:altronate hydrolase